MIKRTFLLFALLLAAYLLIIKAVKPAHPIVQHQWQDNQIKAQTYLYSTDSTGGNVIVGSSLASRLFMDSLPGFTNLAFSGQSIFDGLNIVSHKKEAPVKVFIEMNVVLRGESKTFSENLFNPILFNVRRILPPLRDGYQPLALAGYGLTGAVRGVLSGIKSRLVRKPPTQAVQAAVAVPALPLPAPVKAGNNDLFMKLIKAQIDNYSNVPDNKMLQISLDKLQEYVGLLERRGIKVYFFEMPVDERLCTLPWSRAIRAAFYRTFPQDRYRYVQRPDCAGYETSDGLHLKDPDAIRYTLYFKSQVTDSVILKMPQ